MSTHPAPRKPFIFIVYQDAEFDLANALKSLFECWGYDAFHCRQEERDSFFWKGELRVNIRKCDLVVLLLSTQIIHSPLRIVMVGGVACDSQAVLGRHGGC